MAEKTFLTKKIISSDGPMQDEINHETSLLSWCATRIEPEEESNRRRAVLERLYYLVKQWIKHTMITEFHMPESAAAQVEGRIFATGSYRYNVHTSGSDIDMVLIAPNRITREHFFDTLAPRLKNELWVSELHCIRESRVPIIAMVCDGIDIDLSFGAIRQDRVPEVITDDLLQGLDEQSVLSCNAVRVAHNVMDLVPNKATFRQTLRFIKAWGKVRNIYSNTFGFPSGIGWAILVAFVCQCYPRQNVAGTVGRFFRTYHFWFRSNPHETGVDNRAIYLTESMRARTNLGRCWDPRESRSDAMALFPVLTPALPYGNACYNVTLTNLRQLCEEFARGHEIVSTSLHLTPAMAKRKFGVYGIWSKLLAPVPFFNLYKHYMHIRVTCGDPELYQAYVDGVESRIRILWAGNASSRGHTLEDIKQLRLHLNPRRYEDPCEVDRRTKLLAKNANNSEGNKINERTSVGSTSARSASTSARTSLQLNGSTTTTTKQIDSASNEFNNSANNNNNTELTFTAHYFIGMTVDTSISKNQIDLAPAIRTFRVVVRQLRQFQEGITKLPEISVCTIDKVPEFVKDIAGYVRDSDESNKECNQEKEEIIDKEVVAPSETEQERLNNKYDNDNVNTNVKEDQDEFDNKNCNNDNNNGNDNMSNLKRPREQNEGANRHVMHSPSFEEEESFSSSFSSDAMTKSISASAAKIGRINEGNGYDKENSANNDDANSNKNKKYNDDDEDYLELEQALGFDF